VVKCHHTSFCDKASARSTTRCSESGCSATGADRKYKGIIVSLLYAWQAYYWSSRRSSPLAGSVLVPRMRHSAWMLRKRHLRLLLVGHVD
ncbi:uncharacterized protein METZ01_LOCUS289051, partial [marine metagenome]